MVDTCERLLDASELEPPEPLMRALAAVDDLRPGEYLRLLLRREPFPLYALLDDEGYFHLGRRGENAVFEVLIWRRGDRVAENAVADLAGD